MFKSACLQYHTKKSLSVCPFRHKLKSPYLVDGGAGHVVKEQNKQRNQRQSDQDLEDEPFVVVPEDVTECLHGVQDPEEGGIWTTGK